MSKLSLIKDCKCDGDKFPDGTCCHCFGSGNKLEFNGDTDQIEGAILHIIKRSIYLGHLEGGYNGI